MRKKKLCDTNSALLKFWAICATGKESICHIIIAVFQKIATLRTVSDNEKTRNNRNED